MDIHYSKLPFSIFADDGIVHCRTFQEAQQLKVVLEKRFEQGKLALPPQKTKDVCCKAGKP